jgi:xylan 1,4-beta-xylosidase
MTTSPPFSRRTILAGGAALLATGTRTLAQTPPALRRPPFPIEDDVGRPVPPPPPGYYDVQRRSGPGVPVTRETERGGWVTSEAAVDRKGVRFRGPGPAPANLLPWGESDSGRVVSQGLIPPVKPLLHLHLRDTIVCLGGDGNYYMTGSTGDDIWKANDGVELWRSPDLKSWTYLGLVWDIERDGGWEKRWTIRKGDYFRAVWAPEIHFINGNYFICLSISRSGISVLRSTTGRAEGPYVHAFSPDAPLRNGIDATLFGDDDGSVYLTYGGAFEMVRLKRDMSGYDGDWRPVTLDTPDLDPAHHNKKCVRHGYKDIGFEGATMFKHDGLYYLGAVDRFVNNRYSFALATADTPFGPYRDRYESVPCGGGGNIFRDKQGRWWCTIFGNDDEAPFREKPGIVPARIDDKGHLVADFRPREV